MLTESEILKFIGEDKASLKKRMARQGQGYYEAEHDILQYRMFYFNADGNLVEDKTRSNIKIPHPFFTELVDQAAQYMLSNKDPIIRSDDPELQKRLNEYFGDDFICELNDVLTGTMAKGFEYMYAYMNADGRLSFECADSLGVVEVREKDTDDGCAYVIYWYVDRLTKEDRLIKRIQVWSNKDVTYFVQDEEGKLLPDYCFKVAEGDVRNVRPHIVYHKDNDDATYYENFGFIPWFRLDNNKKQLSGLKPIKPLIDDYDMMSCGLSNNLADFDHPIYAVKGFQGDNLDELSQNLRTKKMIGVDPEGGIETHTVDVPYQARQAKMQEDEKNIYRFGMGFNSAQLGDGNVTNVVIKSRYALLDLKCNKIEIRMKQFLNKIVKVVIAEINRIDGTDYQVEDVWYDFTREVMTNAQDNSQIELNDAQKQQAQINTLLSLNGVLDDETIIQNICEVLDLDYEDIKERLPDDPLADNQNAMNILDAAAGAEGGDDLNE